jgi:hypothetical protein
VADGTEYGLHGDAGLTNSRPSSGQGATLFGPGGTPPPYAIPAAAEPNKDQKDYVGNIPGSCECATKCLQKYEDEHNPGPPYGAISGPNSNKYAHNMLKSCGGTFTPIVIHINRAPRDDGPKTIITTSPPGAINW